MLYKLHRVCLKMFQMKVTSTFELHYAPRYSSEVQNVSLAALNVMDSLFCDVIDNDINLNTALLRHSLCQRKHLNILGFFFLNCAVKLEISYLPYAFLLQMVTLKMLFYPIYVRSDLIFLRQCLC